MLSRTSIAAARVFAGLNSIVRSWSSTDESEPQARGLATSASTEVKLPALVYGVSGRYANALYFSAFKAQNLDKVTEELGTFKQAYDTNANFKRYVCDPSISRQRKADDLLAAFKDTSEVTRKFIGVLCQNGRMQDFEAVMKDFNHLMQAHKKQVFATVTTVVPLTSDEVKAVTEALKGFVAADETVLLECKTNPDILGGMLVSVGDRSVDLSFVRTIEEMKRLVKAPV